MTMREFLAGEFIDIIEWLDETDDTMVWRFSRPRNEIKNGAQLVVRPGQMAVFVEQGEIADVFDFLRATHVDHGGTFQVFVAAARVEVWISESI